MTDRTSSAARIPPGVKGVNAVQEEGPVGGVPEPGGLPAASSAATTCEHGYTGDERDSCACPTCSEQQLLVKVKELTALLREFEAVPVRRLTNHTAVYERSPLDTWRARCGKAVRGWL